MKIDKIIAMASEAVRLRFVAMERSLRDVGCDLPLWVIPYNDERFELPANAKWWDMPEISGWLRANNGRPVMRKYQCLVEENFQFVDADICFLRNPEEVLADQTGWITSCGHWRDVGDTVTPESSTLMRRTSTLWHRDTFNTGQYACDRKLYTVETLQQTAMRPDFRYTCIDLACHEQPGINLLVAESGVEVNNLTLPPLRMESTWAGDYPDEYEKYWSDESRKPYLMHWAGCDMSMNRPIDRIFTDYLTREEKLEWDESVRKKTEAMRRQRRTPRAFARRVKRAMHTFAHSE